MNLEERLVRLIAWIEYIHQTISSSNYGYIHRNGLGHTPPWSFPIRFIWVGIDGTLIVNSILIFTNIIPLLFPLLYWLLKIMDLFLNSTSANLHSNLLQLIFQLIPLLPVFIEIYVYSCGFEIHFGHKNLVPKVFPGSNRHSETSFSNISKSATLCQYC